MRCLQLACPGLLLAGCLLPNPKYGAQDDAGLTDTSTGGQTATRTNAGEGVDTGIDTGPAGTGGPPTSDGGPVTSGTGPSPMTSEGSGAVSEVSGTSAPPVLECDPWDVDSCQGGTQCIPLPEGEQSWIPACVPQSPMPLMLWEPCDDPQSPDVAAQCEPGDFCYANACITLCQGGANAPTCAPDGTECEVVDDGAFGVCLPECDPVMQDCDDGEGCYGFQPEGGPGPVVACLPDGSNGVGTQGGSCASADACAPGLACISAEQLPACPGNACCTAFCTLGVPMICPAPLTCVPFFETPPPGLELTGVCSG